MKKTTFLWIDDESGRIRDARSLARSLKIKVIFEDVRKKELVEVLQGILSGQEPDLVLIDHRLDKVLEGGIIQTGSTTAEVIREKWAECPIVCVTAVRLEDIDLHKKLIYEQVIEYPELFENYPFLISLAKSFKILRRKRPKDIKGFMNLIKAPSPDRPRLDAILPEEIKRGFEGRSPLISISRWIRQTLMAKPGFLYDQLWAATSVGIKEHSFEKVHDALAEAKYKGIFADDGNPRWWQTRIKEILYERFPADERQFTWELGRRLNGVRKQDYSVCYVCKKEFPEIVGFTDETAQTRKPMHLRCSVSHPRFEKALFFEEIRMMKAAE
jgi:CheY-like chemotaxis protein